MFQTLLSKRLKELERVGVVERRGANPRRREWHLHKPVALSHQSFNI